MAVNAAPSFNVGGTGKVVTQLTPTDFGTGDRAYDVVVQPDGKIVVSGGAYNGFGVARYNADGSLDTGFGTGGKVVEDPTSSGAGDGYPVVVQPDGKIILVGDGNVGSDVVVFRYNVDGTPDTGFGTGGKVTTPAGGGVATWDAALQADGKILVSGNGNDFQLVRYNTNGTLDTGFGAGGKVSVPIRFPSVEVQDGKILVAGRNDAGFAVARFNADGTPDTNFGVGGVATLADGGSFQANMAVQPDGKIVISGDGSLFVARFNENGTLDTGFGTGGKADIPGGSAKSVSIAPDDKIVVGGNVSGDDYVVGRFNEDGTPDTSFGQGGRVVTQFFEGTGSVIDLGYEATVQPDGKIVLVGYVQQLSQGQPRKFGLARYNDDGSLDTTFGGTTSLGGAVAYAENAAAIVLDADVTVSDHDLDGLNGGLGDYAGASLTLARSSGASAQDVFGFKPDGFTVSGSTLKNPGGQTFATFTSTGGELVVTFTGSGVATTALASAVARAVTYANGSDAPPASVAIGWTLSDGGTDAKTTTGTSTVAITRLNDAPTASGLTQSLTLAEDGPAAKLFTGAVSLADPDSASLTATLTLSNPAAGTLTGATASATPGLYTITGSPAAVRAALEAVRFQAAADYNGTLTVAVAISDGQTGPQGTNPSGSVSITVTPVNDVPVARDDPETVLQRQILTGNVIKDAPADSDADTGDTLTVSQIVFSGATKAVGAAGTALQGDHGTLTIKGDGSYSYDANVEGKVTVGDPVTDTFTYTIGDGQGGADTASLTVTVTGSKLGNPSGNIFLMTGSGAEALGRGGNDTYFIDQTSDRIVESAGGGTDTVKAFASYALSANLENLTLYGRGDLDGTGNADNNTIRGNDGDNVLAGKLGNDILIGGGGKDTFVFDTAPGPRNVDHIEGYSIKDDTIALDDKVFKALANGPLKAGQFKDITNGAKLDADDRVLYDHDSGRLWYDADGSGSGARVQFAILDNHPTLTFQDFLVV